MYRAVIQLPSDPRIVHIRPLAAAQCYFGRHEGRCLIVSENGRDGETCASDLMEWLGLAGDLRLGRNPTHGDLDSLYQTLMGRDDSRARSSASSKPVLLHAVRDELPRIADISLPPRRLRDLHDENWIEWIPVRDAEGTYSAEFIRACLIYLNDENLVFRDISSFGKSISIAYIISKLGRRIPRFCHLPDLRTEASVHLTDSPDNLSIEELRSLGILPSSLVAYLLILSDLVDTDDLQRLSWEDLADSFRFAYDEAIPLRFSFKTLKDMNAGYMTEAAREKTGNELNRILDLLRPLLKEARYPSERSEDLRMKCKMVLEQSDTLVELCQSLGIFYGQPQPLEALHHRDRTMMLQADSVRFLRDILERAHGVERKWSSESDFIAGVVPSSYRGKLPVGPYRLAKTFAAGSLQGPHLYMLAQILGPDGVIDLWRKRLAQIDDVSTQITGVYTTELFHPVLLQKAVTLAGAQRGDQIIIIEGLAGSGKSYLTVQMIEALREIGHQCCIVEAGAGDEIRLQMQLFDRLLEIGEKMHANWTRIFARMPANRKTWGEIQLLIDNILSAAGSDRKVVVAIDDFDGLRERSASVASSLAGMLRFLERTHKRRFTIILTVKDEADLEKALSVFRDVGEPISLRLGAIEDRIAGRYLGAVFGRGLPSGIAGRIIHLAGGNATGLIAMARCQKSGEIEMDATAQVEAADPRVSLLSRYFTGLWRSLKPLEKAVLVSAFDRFVEVMESKAKPNLLLDHFNVIDSDLDVHLAKSTGHRPALGLFDDDAIEDVSSRLESLGLLRSRICCETATRFVFSPLFGLWMKQNASMEDVLKRHKRYFRSIVGVDRMAILMDLTEGRTNVFLRRFRPKPDQDQRRRKCLEHFRLLSESTSIRRRDRALKFLFRDILGIPSFSSVDRELWSFCSEPIGLKKVPREIYVTYIRDGNGLLNSVQQFSESAFRYQFKGRLCIIVYYGTQLETVEAQIADREIMKCFILGRDAFERVVFSADSVRELRFLIVKSMGPKSFSPYQLGGVLTDLSLFQGRESEVEDLCDATAPGHLVVGGRSVGKSSLLRAASHRLREQGALCLHFGGEGCKDVSDFLVRIGNELRDYDSGPWRSVNLGRLDGLVRRSGRFVAKKIGLWPKARTREITLDNLDGILRSYCRKGRNVHFMIDETEELFKNDYPEMCRLLGIFRDVVENRPDATFAVAGWRELAKASRDEGFPLFNVGREAWLGAIEREAALRLLEEPMAKLGVSFGSAEAERELLKETSGHPYLVQFVCDRLLQGLSKPPFEITLVQVKDVLQAMEFQDERLKMFYGFLSPLDRSIVAVFERGSTHLTLVAIHSRLAHKRIDVDEDDLRRSILGLKANSILKEVRGEFAIAFECFYDALKKREG